MYKLVLVHNYESIIIIACDMVYYLINNNIKIERRLTMPGRDGTGPFGSGPFNGRRRGQCKGFFSIADNQYTQKAGIASVLIPFVGIVIRELANPNSLIREVSRKLFGSRKPEPARTAINADYVVLDDDNAYKKSKKEIKIRKQIL